MKERGGKEGGRERGKEEWREGGMEGGRGGRKRGEGGRKGEIDKGMWMGEGRRNRKTGRVKRGRGAEVKRERRGRKV